MKAETGRQRDRENMFASMLPCFPVVVTSIVTSLVPFLGLATVPTVVVMSVYISAFDKNLPEKGFASVLSYPSSVQELFVLSIISN